MYFNVEFVHERIAELMVERPDPVRLVVLSLGSVPVVDLAGAEMIKDLHHTLTARGVAFRVANVHGEVRDGLRKIGFDRAYGELESGQTVDLVIARWSAGEAPGPADR